MPDRPHRDERMDAYDTRMVAALRAVVEGERPTSQYPGADEVARRRRLRRPWLVAAAAVAVVGGGLVVVPTLQAQPAWAVSRDGAGDVEVKVNRFDDAAGLEQALAAEGVTADVTFLPDGYTCAPGRYPEGGETPSSGLTVSSGEGTFGATVPAGAVPEGATLVIAASARRLSAAELRALDEDPDDDVLTVSGTTAWVEFDVVEGPVAACQPVRAPLLGVGESP